jgi:hypothetical protein
MVFVGFLVDKIVVARKELLKLLLLVEDADLGTYLDCRLDDESLLLG